MKKFIVLLLAALLIVGLCVSCKDSPKPVAPEEDVAIVVEATLDAFGTFGPYANYVAGEGTPADVKAAMDPSLKSLFENGIFLKPVTVTSTVTKTSITAEIVDEDNINKLKVEITNLLLDSEGYVSGSFKMYATGIEEGRSLTIDVKSDFSSPPSLLGSTVTYSYVKFCGTEYDLTAFNEAMKKALEDWPPIM